jgi:hypothetical protein
MKQKLSTIELYNALLLCNDTVNHTHTQQQLLDAICHNMIQIDGISMAWVGMIENGSTQLHPVAYAGKGSDYLNEISIDLNDPLLGEGPTGKAYKQDQAYWAQDFLNDPATKPWHEKAKQYGWHSSATLPLKKMDWL